MIIIPFAVSGLGIYSMSKSDIEDLIICSTNSDSHYIPTGICELYLVNSRGTVDDIKFLESRSGIAFVFEISDETKRSSLLEFLISKGVNVNKVSSIDGYYPLHSAVIMNDHFLVSYLIDKGAQLGVKDRDRNLTPVELLKYLQKNSPEIDRRKVDIELSRGLSHNKSN